MFKNLLKIAIATALISVTPGTHAAIIDIVSHQRTDHSHPDWESKPDFYVGFTVDTEAQTTYDWFLEKDGELIGEYGTDTFEWKEICDPDYCYSYDAYGKINFANDLNLFVFLITTEHGHDNPWDDLATGQIVTFELDIKIGENFYITTNSGVETTVRHMVPEPSTIALLALGILGLGIRQKI
ncbi:PEP-CTERM sorting domain-containing protein [Marinobacter sp. BGYM27]|uniref:PEP-CTERM sorting domain-containing protein n=1 Tax=Marinobacter sp. BGYM27 TaxID=2975597 RepID=UPI0021A2D28D|nr:PEP-CTERM sorting domain-containing protein [Marinobacter sp. BGYM27]MDG5498953.1 PEP-CTERM sorting domain-containing protein [Marinobacter sp. BGYM27]